MARSTRAMPEAMATLDDVLQRWAHDQRSLGLSESSVQRQVKRVAAYARSLSGPLLHASGMDLKAFAAARARGYPGGPHAFLRSPGWAKSSDAISSFFSWAKRSRLIPENPLAGLRRFRPQSASRTIGPRLAKRYDRLRSWSGLDARDAALLALLGHGLLPGEAARVETADVDLELRLLLRVSQRVRTVPLSARAVDAIGPWLRTRRVLGEQYLFGGAKGSPLTSAGVSARVRRCARACFRFRSQYVGINAAGFRHILIRKCLQKRVRLSWMVAVLHLDRVSRLHVGPIRANHLHKELERLGL